MWVITYPKADNYVNSSRRIKNESDVIDERVDAAVGEHQNHREVKKPVILLKVDADEAEKVGDLTCRPANDESTADQHGRHNGIALSFVC